MKRNGFLIISCILAVQLHAGLLYDIVDGKYRVKGFEALRSMNDGEHYSQKIQSNAVVKFSYKSGASIDTLFSIFQAKKCPIKSISGYILSPNEQKMLVYTNVKYRYRRSFTADYYVYDIKRKEIYPLSEGSQQVPLFSPDSRYIAFAKNNNLYIHKLDFGTEIAVTKDGEPGKIINGTPDWVYEEEFEATCHFTWSPDSKLLAFTKFIENEVPEFSFQTFKSTEKDAGINLYPGFERFKYPKAGEKNSKVMACVYDDFNKTTRIMKISDANEDIYIPRIRWTRQSDQLLVFKLNRNQNQLDVLMCDPRSTTSKLLLRETDSRYVNYEIIDHMTFSLDNNFFFWLSERDGYKHIYQYRINGQMLKQLTKGNWEVTDFYGYNDSKKLLYYQSTETSALQRDIFSVDLNGKKTKLSDGKGTHIASFNTNYTYFTDNVSSLTEPNRYILSNSNGTLVRNIDDNKTVKSEFEKLNLPVKSFFKFTTSKKNELNGWMLKPVEFDPNKKYPVLQIQYSGPGSQQVLDRWEIGWEYYLASKGYVVVCVDGRGTGARGAEFCKTTYGKLGIYEAIDQVETAKYLASQSFIDKNRIGIWGWSFGGSTTLWSMSTGENIFKAGISVAPVTDWQLYNTAYTERFMKRPQENFDGYKMTSAINLASKLSGKLLIIHGTADDNVHYQNTLLYIDKLVENDKQFEMQVYTDKNHSITGKQTRRHLYTRMSEFLFKNL